MPRYIKSLAWAVRHCYQENITPKDTPNAVAWLYLQTIRKDEEFLKRAKSHLSEHYSELLN